MSKVKNIIDSTQAIDSMPLPLAVENPLYGLGHIIFIGSAAARMPVYAATLLEHLKNRKLKTTISNINNKIQTAKNLNTEKALTYGATGLALGTTAGLLGNNSKSIEQSQSKYSYMSKNTANFDTFLNAMGVPVAGVGIWWLHDALKKLGKTRLEGKQLAQAKQLATDKLASTAARNKYMGLSAIPAAGLGYLGAKSLENQTQTENTKY